MFGISQIETEVNACRPKARKEIPSKARPEGRAVCFALIAGLFLWVSPGWGITLSVSNAPALQAAIQVMNLNTNPVAYEIRIAPGRYEVPTNAPLDFVISPKAKGQVNRIIGELGPNGERPEFRGAFRFLVQDTADVTVANLAAYRTVGSLDERTTFPWPRSVLMVAMRSQRVVITNCLFAHESASSISNWMYLHIHGTSNVVAGCQFTQKRELGPMVRVEIDAPHLNHPTWTNQVHAHVLRDCVFSDFNLTDTNVNSASGFINLGLDADAATWSGCVISNNLFRNFNNSSEREMICNKASGARYANNVFTNTVGFVSLRLGDACVVEANLFLHCNGAVRLYGRNHRVVNNYFDDIFAGGTNIFYVAAVQLGGGEVTHSNAENNFIVHNTMVNARFPFMFYKQTGATNFPQNNVFENNLAFTTVGASEFIYIAWGGDYTNALFRNQWSSNTWRGNLFDSRVAGTPVIPLVSTSYVSAGWVTPASNQNFIGQPSRLLPGYLEPKTGWTVQIPAAGSTAVDNGDGLGFSAAVTNDLLGLSRPGADGARHIGCHETNVCAGTLLWDASTASAGVQDGAGAWNSALTNWWDGSFNTNWNGAFFQHALFGAGGTGGTVTAAAPLGVASLTFFPVRAVPYTIGGAGLSFSNGASVRTLGAPATISAPITGPNGFTKTGANALTLTGTNTFSGITLISEGTLALPASAVIANTALFIAEGAGLTGSGRVGVLTSAGLVAPGPPVGTLSGNAYTQSVSGVLNLEIAGAGSNDLLSISGPARLAGTLNVTLANTNYLPAAGDTFRILSSAGGLGGTMFTAVNLPWLPGGQRWGIQADNTNVVLSVLAPATNYGAWASAITNGLTNYTECAAGDGFPNLLKYATGSNPAEADNLARLQGRVVDGAFVLQFNRNPNAVDVGIVVEGVSMVNSNTPWQGIVTNRQGAWSGAATVTESITNQPVSVTVQETAPQSGRRFFRLRITQP